MRFVLPVVLIACGGSPTPPVDTDCTIGFADRDGDGYGNPQLQTTDCVEFIADNPDDCDDGNFSARPDAEEICDELDNDCDGLVDGEDDSLDRPLQYPDLDGDGFGTEPGVLDCAPLLDHAAVPGDCDDDAFAVHPDALEICDGIDNDCDALVDDDDPSLDSVEIGYLDSDLDGFGGASFLLSCDPPPGVTATSDDCDDTDPAVYPGAVEICDGLDQNCDGSPDVPPFTPDPCTAFETSYDGLFQLDLSDGLTPASCTGTASLSLDRATSPPLQGVFECTLDDPQAGWSPTQSGAITGLFRADGTLQGSVEAFEGVSYEWTGTIVGSELDGVGAGLFQAVGAWDLSFEWSLSESAPIP